MYTGCQVFIGPPEICCIFSKFQIRVYNAFSCSFTLALDREWSLYVLTRFQLTLCWQNHLILPVFLATRAATSACLYWLWGGQKCFQSDVRVVPRFSSPRNALPDKCHLPGQFHDTLWLNRFCFYWPIPPFPDHRYHRALWLVGLAPTVFFLSMGAVTLSVSLLLHLGLHLGDHLLHSSKLWNTKHCHV